MKKLLLRFLIETKQFKLFLDLCLLFFVLILSPIYVNSQTTKTFTHSSSYYGMISSSNGYIPQISSLYVGYYSTYNEINRGYIEFDISTIPSNATITAASLNLRCTGIMGTNTNTGGTVLFKNLANRIIAFASLADWNSLNGSSQFASIAVDWGGSVTISNSDLITKVKNNISSGYLYFGLVNSVESSNGIYFSTSTSDLYLSVTYTIPGPTIPPVPTGLNYSNPTSTSLHLSWNASSGATSYNVYYGGNTRSTTSTSIDIPDLQPETTYSFTVSATNSAGTSAKSAPISATTLPLPPATPTGLTASNITCTGISLSWNASSGTVTGYKVYQNGVLKSTVLVPTININYTDLTSNTSYSYTISAYNNGGESAQSSGVPITTLTAPNVPYAFHPTSVSSSSIGLTWNAVNGATLYYVYLYYDGRFFTKLATTTTYWGSSGFNGPYCFYVTSYNGVCESPMSYGICYTFKFPSLTKSSTEASIETLSKPATTQDDIYPNPVSDKLYIAGISDFDATILDLTGQKVLSVSKANESIDVSGLTPGVYIVKITSAGGSLTKKIIKQ